MKRYEDLTHEEWIALEEADIERFIDIEIAEAGIMPISCPTMPTLEDEGIVKSEVAYDIGGLLLKNEEDATKVATMQHFQTSYDYSAGGYDYQWLDPVLEKKVSKKLFYKQVDVVRIKEILQRNKSKRDEYDGRKSKYDKYLQSTGSIRDAVYSVYYEARQLEGEYKEAEKVFIKYRGLSDGDDKVAMSFFSNTYKDRPDILKKFGVEVKAEVEVEKEGE